MGSGSKVFRLAYNEKRNESGYPKWFEDLEITLARRIVVVANAYDISSSIRTYWKLLWLRKFSTFLKRFMN